MKVDGLCQLVTCHRELKIKDKTLQENQGRRFFWGGEICGFLTMWCSNEDGVYARFVVSVVGRRTG